MNFKEKIMLKTVFCILSQNKDILKHQSLLKQMFSLGNRQDCLMKKLNLLEKLILQHFDKEKIYLTFNSDILAQEKIAYNYESIVNIYVV